LHKRIIILFFLLFVCEGIVMSAKKAPLKEYQKRRNFTKTPEPCGDRKESKTKHIFVIQKHAATHLHYDFRIEIDGVLKSWAVPKGPSTDPRVKRLAVETEDHPTEYAKFEGVIPEGEYGGGTVMVWDYGTYKNIKEKKGKLIPMRTCYKNGAIEIFLKGKKLDGGYALVRMKRPATKKQWLLIKMKDEYADARRNPVNTEKKSALTGRTMNQIAKEEKGKKFRFSCK
jgi:DNA ligase D-like protein (predicted 3'-phosphoesterase)